MRTNNVSIAAIGFGPSFLKNRHPNFIFVGLTKNWFSFRIDWNIIINKNLFNDPINPQKNFIDAIFGSFLKTEDGFDSLLSFGDG